MNLTYFNGQLIEETPSVSVADQTSIIKEVLTTAVETHLNTKASEYRYKDYHAAMAYVGSPVPKYNAEGIAFRNWVSSVWAYMDALETEITTNNLAVPTVEQLIQALPEFTI